MAERDEAVVSASADRGVSGVPAELAQARVTIDNIDAALVHILAERFRCTQRVGHIKARLDLPPADPEREARQVERLRALAGTIGWLAAALATTTSVYTDDVHLVDSTPIECARSRPTVMRSDLAGWAGYGYCASHSRFFWGLRLHLVCTVHGLPVAWAVTSPGQDEREVLRSMLEHLAPTSARTIIADKGYRSKDLEDDLNQAGLTLLRPAARNEAPRPGAGLLRPLRQRIESVFDTLKDQLGLERHNGRTPTGVTTRVAQRILALTAAIWHNDKTGNPHLRSLTPYDH